MIAAGEPDTSDPTAGDARSRNAWAHAACPIRQAALAMMKRRRASEPLGDGFAQAVRQQIVEVEMKLGNDPDMGAAVAIAGNQRLYSKAVAVGGVVDANAP